jgi:hypothetical protein
MGTYLRVQAVYDFQPAAGGDQVFVNTYDILVPSGWGSWSDFATQLHNLHVALAGDMPAAIQPRECRFYRPEDPLPDGRPLQVWPLPKPFTGAANPMFAPQTCCVWTERTETRKAWGRVYFPAPTTQHGTTSGTFAPTWIAKLATEAKKMYDAWAANDIQPVVVTTKELVYNRVPFPPMYDEINVNFFHEVLEIRVDNVPDIQRRRRHEAATAKELRTLVRAS